MLGNTGKSCSVPMVLVYTQGLGGGSGVDGRRARE